MSALAGDLLAGSDPALLAHRLGVRPDPWQLEVLRSADQRLLLCCSRQAGKSTVSALLCIHTALFDPGSLTLLFAPSQRQALELFRTIVRFYRGLGRPVPAEGENALSLTLENGSRIVALPGDERTVRGYSAAKLMVIDEASRVDDTFYSTVRPMLAVSGGRLVALSTPFGKRGWFHDAATSAAGWKVVKITAEECPRISPAFLAEERTTLGDWLYRQEYGCEFVDANSSYFDPGDIDAMFAHDVQPLMGGRP